jgi:hypothetical protein
MMKKRILTLVAAVTALVITAALPAAAGDTAARCRGQSLYVPVYSHIYSGDRERPFYLAVTLSIRNTDPRHFIHLSRVDYYDTDGKLLRHYLEAPMTLSPLASVRYVIGEGDKAGGSGANFIVAWHADQPVVAPVVESVMIGTYTQQGISFTSRARVIETVGQ